MSMIHCPECGEMISDKAYACAKCGRPLKDSRKGELIVMRVLVFVLAFTTVLLIIVPNRTIKEQSETSQVHSEDQAMQVDTVALDVPNAEETNVATSNQDSIEQLDTQDANTDVLGVAANENDGANAESPNAQQEATQEQQTQPQTQPGSDTQEVKWAGDDKLDFTMQTNEGDYFSLSGSVGEVVVLNFWATWCGYCVDELPAFQKLYDEYGNDSGVKIVTINCGETSNQAHRFLVNYGYTFPCIYDTADTLGDKYNITGIPLTVIFNKDGTVARWLEGQRDYDTFNTAIMEALYD